VASAAQSWVRSIGVLIQTQGLLGKELSATQLVEIANEADDAESVAIPGVAPKAEDDDKAKRVGLLLKQVFKDASTVEIDTFQIKRIQWEEQTEKRFVSKVLS
jgi:hypothetical protein